MNYGASGQSRKCLQDHGIDNITLFATPRGIGYEILWLCHQWLQHPNFTPLWRMETLFQLDWL